MSKGYAGQLRIVGGRLRGRKLPVGSAPGLRPTTQRVRETVFNWLQPWIQGARCLDLFSGSGALGFEAASRGAADVWLVERDRSVATQLEGTAERLGEPGVHIVHADARAFLTRSASRFDIVFLDPPFRSELLENTCKTLEVRGWLVPRALIYLEAEVPLEELRLPGSWGLHRAKCAGDVHYGIAVREPITCA